MPTPRNFVRLGTIGMTLIALASAGWASTEDVPGKVTFT